MSAPLASLSSYRSEPAAAPAAVLMLAAAVAADLQAAAAAWTGRCLAHQPAGWQTGAISASVAAQNAAGTAAAHCAQRLVTLLLQTMTRIKHCPLSVCAAAWSWMFSCRALLQTHCDTAAVNVTYLTRCPRVCAAACRWRSSCGPPQGRHSSASRPPCRRHSPLRRAAAFRAWQIGP